MPVKSGGTKRKVVKVIGKVTKGKVGKGRGGQIGRAIKPYKPKVTNHPQENFLPVNLICGDGHKAFAPNPKFWVGKKCHVKGCVRKVNLIGRLRRPKKIARI